MKTSCSGYPDSSRPGCWRSPSLERFQRGWGGGGGCGGTGGGGGGGGGDSLFPSPEFSAVSRLLSAQWVFCPLWTWTHNSDKTLSVRRNSVVFYLSVPLSSKTWGIFA